MERRHPDVKEVVHLKLSPTTPPQRADLNITIDSDNKQYYVEILDGCRPREGGPCAFSSDDLSRTYRSLCEMFDRVLQGHESLYQLASIGYFVFCSIFPKPSMQQTIRDLVAASDNSTPIYLLVHSQHFVIPWALLYLQRPTEDEVDCTQFLGFRCMVAINIMDPEKLTNPPTPEIQPCINVLAGYCSMLPFSRTIEVPFIRRIVHRAQQAASITLMPPLVARNGRPTAAD